MISIAWLQMFVLLLLLTALAPWLGSYMCRVFEGEKHILSSLLGPVERTIYRFCKIDSTQEMNWKEYLKTLLIFNALGIIFLFLIQILQGILPLNGRDLPHVPWAIALNTAISFVTNTDLQAYSGEVTMSNLTQMSGLAVQNFLSAATGMTVLLALTRGIVRKAAQTLGNFWQDLVRTVLYILLPLSIIFALFLVVEGVVQTFDSSVVVTTLEKQEQQIPLGPVASQVAIKQLGTNGGGFFGANGAHPFENPTPNSNFFQTLAILLIPAAQPFMFARMIKSKKDGTLLYIVMTLLLVMGFLIAFFATFTPNPVFGTERILEGIETRFVLGGTVPWAVSTTATGNGSVNAMLDSLSPMAGGVALFNMLLSEVIFGGMGVGMTSMLMFVLLTVFVAGLMVGRTPEYLGKKIESKEMRMVILAILIPSAVILIGAGISIILPEMTASILNRGPHGLTEVVYAFSSAAHNNGSTFSGLKIDTNSYALVLALAMLIGRLAMVVTPLVIAGHLVQKKVTPASAGTFSTDNVLFAVLLLGVIFIVGILSFMPVLTLGPWIEQLLMLKGQAF